VRDPVFPPTVTAVGQSDNEAIQVSITFSEPMDETVTPSNLGFELLDQVGPFTANSITWRDNELQLTFVPADISYPATIEMAVSDPNLRSLATGAIVEPFFKDIVLYPFPILAQEDDTFPLRVLLTWNMDMDPISLPPDDAVFVLDGAGSHQSVDIQQEDAREHVCIFDIDEITGAGSLVSFDPQPNWKNAAGTLFARNFGRSIV